MKPGLLSDALSHLPFADLLAQAARLGVAGIEVTTGGWSAAPHFDLPQMKSSATARKAFRQAFDDHGLEIISLNANGNPLHPTDRSQGDCLLDTIRVAGEMGIEKVCTMSGLPAGSPGDTTPNWVVTAFPPETQDILRFQWDDVLLPFWEGLVAVARDSGVKQIALEMHGNQCVYNVPTMMRLRDMVGPTVGANLDPSQLFWMGADPLAAADALGDAIFHVHARDTALNALVQATTSRLDTGALADVAARSWSPVTLGYGHGADWWRRFCYRLRMAGYDGWLCVDHDDVLFDAADGLEKSLALLRAAMPAAVDAPDA